MELLQIATAWFITKCDGQLYTNCDSFFITKRDTVYYKLRQVLQSAMILLNHSFYYVTVIYSNHL